MDRFTQAYIECALWSSIDYSKAEAHSFQELNYDASDLAPAAIKQIEEDCKDFQDSNAAMLAGIDPEQAGHDFWLTRNRHGAGFWDRGLGAIGDELTANAHAYGSCDLYVGDDGLIYIQ